MGNPNPTIRRRDPVRLAIIRSCSCRQAILASTANSGRVCSHAKILNAKARDIKVWAVSAAQPITNAANKITIKLQLSVSISMNLRLPLF